MYPRCGFGGWGNIWMYPCSGFWYRRTSECTLVRVFGTGEPPPKPPLWKPPFCEPPNKISSNNKDNSQGAIFVTRLVLLDSRLWAASRMQPLQPIWLTSFLPRCHCAHLRGHCLSSRALCSMATTVRPREDPSPLCLCSIQSLRIKVTLSAHISES